MPSFKAYPALKNSNISLNQSLQDGENQIANISGISNTIYQNKDQNNEQVVDDFNDEIRENESMMDM